MSNLSTLPKGDSAWLLRKAIERIMEQVSVLETNIGSSTTGNSANTQIIFNDAGTLRGDAGLVYNKTTDALTVAGLVTAGSATITGDLTVRTNKLAVTSTGVGFGTPAPNSPSHFYGSGRVMQVQPAASTASTYLAFSSDNFVSNRALVGIDGSAASIWAVGGSAYSLNIGTVDSNSICFGAANAEQYRIAPSGVFTWYDGAGGTRMTLNSTGLVVGTSAPFCGFEVHKPSLTAFTNLPANAAVSDSTAMAAGVGGGIFFQGRSDATTNVTTFGIISGVKENGTNANVAGALVFGVRDASGGTAIERLRINSTGNIVMKNANTGIDFSINSEAAGMTSELLNDYEEGTWMGTLRGSVSDPTTPAVSGRYTKIGRQVYVQINFANVNTTGASGNVSITGLPFTNNASITSQGSILSDTALTFTGSPFVFVEVNESKFIIYQSTSNAAATACTHNAGTARYLFADLTYTVA